MSLENGNHRLSVKKEIDLSIVDFLTKTMPVRVWDCYCGYGTFIVIECGSKKIDKKFNYETGDPSIWVYLCNWKFRHHDTILFTTDRPYCQSEGTKIFASLKGRDWVGIKEEEAGKRLRFLFSDDYSLELNASVKNYGAKSHLFTIHSQEYPTLCYSPQKCFYFWDK